MFSLKVDNTILVILFHHFQNVLASVTHFW